jgi:two-component system response regulator RegA
MDEITTASSNSSSSSSSSSSNSLAADPSSKDAKEKPQLLIVEDDEAFARTLARSFERRGYRVLQAASLPEVEAMLTQHTPGYAVVDLKLKGDASGLACVQKLHAASEAMLIVVLTGFASIATAVEAVKLGACHYLAKPSNTDDIEAAFGLKAGDTGVDVTNRSSSLKTLEWERIHEVLAETGFNISETARRLGMHRRTLARKLEKQQVS